MEIEGEDGSKIEVGIGSKAVFGRGCGFNTKDRWVSRRHVIFELDDKQTVSFQVVGKNPICVRSGEENVKIFRRLEKGVVAAGDWFYISSQNPVRFRLKRRIGGRRVQESDSGNWYSERFDLSKIDPVKEFGFLVIGHELDCYPKRRIKDARSWDWFLEEPEQDSEGGESSERKKKNGRGKRKKKVRGNDDNYGDDWSGESEDDEVVGKIIKVDRPKYSTGSKGLDKPRQDKKERVSARKTNEDDETLGAFIVDDDEEERGQGGEGDEEEDDIVDDDNDYH
ncbi:hypothetical protein POTOM_001578 [Populus tomentosa]|uniref:SMAD/FHA domain-containing protein n=1 Tax=Populus tomentosa TaxID=118781 RepID=A0A8X8DI42_POPTO|nr:hypothetical protein POTOM_001578 [Populus tomentosa]